MKMSIPIAAAALLVAAGVTPARHGGEVDSLASGEKGTATGAKVTEILGRSCAVSGCHAGKNPKMKLDLGAPGLADSLLGAPSRQNGAFMLIDPEDPSRSYLLIKLTGADGMKGRKMPMMKPPLGGEDLGTVMTWVREIAADSSRSGKKDE